MDGTRIMKIENNIGWCDATTNAVTGCDKVSPGCKNCYAQVGTRARVLRAQGIETWGAAGIRQPVNFAPVFRKLNKLCICDKCHTAQDVRLLTEDEPRCTEYSFNEGACNGRLRRIRLFADSNSDWLDEKWSFETRVALLNAIRESPNLDVLLLTKRIENWSKRMDEVCDHPQMDSELAAEWLNGFPPANLWLGVSVENQACKHRLETLHCIPAAVKFASFEPLLEDLKLSRDDLRMLDWAIVGGESGKDRRDCYVGAVIHVAEQCRAAKVPVYVKQDCAFRSGQQGRIPDAIWNLKQFPSPLNHNLTHTLNPVPG